MITPVGWLFESHLTVANLDRSIAFYRDRVGLQLAHLVRAREAAFFWVGSRGTTMLGLWGAGFGPLEVMGHIAFAAALNDVFAAPLALRAAGITALDFDGQPTNEPVVLAWMPAASVYFRDPDGHLLEYIAMLPHEPRPEDGVVTWHEWTVARGVSRGSNGPGSEYLRPMKREFHYGHSLCRRGSCPGHLWKSSPRVFEQHSGHGCDSTGTGRGGSIGVP